MICKYYSAKFIVILNILIVNLSLLINILANIYCFEAKAYNSSFTPIPKPNRYTNLSAFFRQRLRSSARPPET